VVLEMKRLGHSYQEWHADNEFQPDYHDEDVGRANVIPDEASHCCGHCSKQHTEESADAEPSPHVDLWNELKGHRSGSYCRDGEEAQQHARDH